ncbi:MAG: PqqD family protein [Hyphomicrobium sp.]|uniref:PqqD family protein n=1 Tax=Hyphomicrobium sp. TaxID=82 RepID=UPI003D0EDF8F
MDLDETFSPAGSRIAAKVLEGELTIINLDNGLYYASSGVGVTVWERMDRGASLREVVDAIVNRYDVEPGLAESDARAFLEKLRSEALVESGGPKPATPDVTGEGSLERLRYASPELLKFDDMAEHFALDPPLVIRARP